MDIVDIRKGLLYFFVSIPIGGNCLQLSLMLNISQILYLFLKLKFLESTQSSPPQENSSQRCMGVQKSTKNAAELICYPV
jgi:hypothetical protein